MMRFPSILSFISIAGIASELASARPWHSVNTLKPRRTASILNNVTAQPDLPSAEQATAAAGAASLNLSNIQGDILIGMKKQKELFYFFNINDASTFKSKLYPNISSLITTTHQLLDVSTQPITAVNLAFSQAGLDTLGVTDPLGDSDFQNGQRQGASALGDPGTTNWVPAFANDAIHCVFLLASDNVDNINAELVNIQSILGSSITEMYRLQGSVRPGTEEGHEHFGFMDGISQPAVKGFTATPTPGQTMVDAGHFLLGEEGDNVIRPAWAKDGSFLAFRQLQQLVPEFNKFLTDHPIVEGMLTPEQGSALLGARMVGRWKSGAPVDLAPLFDDPVLAADPNRNNNFTFAFPGEDIRSNQTRCPFSAHVRKTNPRADLTPENRVNHIIRAGIPYGPEVSDSENASNSTTDERGLAFVAYQSTIGNGFKFIQERWADNPNFVFGKNDSTPGFDPIIGANAGNPRTVSGLDPTDATHDITLVTDFVVSRGGEYFFSPSLSAIAHTLAK